MANATATEPRPAARPPEKAAEPAPYGDEGAAYLLSRGWKCLGSNGRPDRALWLDPTKPLLPSYSEEPCMYDVEIREEYVEDGKVKQRYRTEQRQVMAQDGRGGASVGARRTVYHPAVTPLGLEQALLIQVERDARADLARTKERK